MASAPRHAQTAPSIPQIRCQIPLGLRHAHPAPCGVAGDAASLVWLGRGRRNQRSLGCGGDRRDCQLNAAHAGGGACGVFAAGECVGEGAGVGAVPPAWHSAAWLRNRSPCCSPNLLLTAIEKKGGAINGHLQILDEKNPPECASWRGVAGVVGHIIDGYDAKSR